MKLEFDVTPEMIAEMGARKLLKVFEFWQKVIELTATLLTNRVTDQLEAAIAQIVATFDKRIPELVRFREKALDDRLDAIVAKHSREFERQMELKVKAALDVLSDKENSKNLHHALVKAITQQHGDEIAKIVRQSLATLFKDPPE